MTARRLITKESRQAESLFTKAEALDRVDGLSYWRDVNIFDTASWTPDRSMHNGTFCLQFRLINFAIVVTFPQSLGHLNLQTVPFTLTPTLYIAKLNRRASGDRQH